MTGLLLALLLPPVAGVVLARLAPRAAGYLAPSAAVPMLTIAALATAVGSGFTLAVLALTAAGRNAEVAEQGHWSVAALRVLAPVPAVVGLGAGLLVTVLAIRGISHACRAAGELARAGLVCRRLGAGVGGLVVVESPHPDAYALPGVAGRVVVSTGMLAALPAAERRVLLAHESSHLEHRHYLYLVGADLAAAANPLLRPVAAAVRTGVERWADEDAAAVTGDRTVAARALARASLARTAAPAADGAASTSLRGAAGRSRRSGRVPSRAARAPGLALSMANDAVVARARALLAPAPRSHRAVVVALLGLVLVSTTANGVTAHLTEQQFERAQAAYATGGPLVD